MVLEQVTSGPGVVEWGLPEMEVGEVCVSVGVDELVLDTDDARLTWCPVCTTRTRMRAVMTPGRRRFDVCDGCALLWHIDRHTGLAVANRWSLG